MTIPALPIVVGVDESPGSDQALAWAIEEARSRKVSVRLVHAYGAAVVYGGLPLYGALPGPDLSIIRDGAARLVARAAARAAELAPDVSIETDITEDDAAHGLIGQSSSASLIVLGSRHLGTVGATIRGSVGAAVSARAACPLVVVRGLAGLPAEHAAVVVGVDAQPTSETVLGFAFEYASRRSVPLNAVLCWQPDILAEMMWRPVPPAPERAEAWLSEALAGWRQKYPEVAVHSGVVREHPVAGLVAASTAQHLLVVGSRGRHALASALLGSVSRGVLHHATFPVAVVPSAIS